MVHNVKKILMVRSFKSVDSSNSNSPPQHSALHESKKTKRTSSQEPRLKSVIIKIPEKCAADLQKREIQRTGRESGKIQAARD